MFRKIWKAIVWWFTPWGHETKPIHQITTVNVKVEGVAEAIAEELCRTIRTDKQAADFDPTPPMMKVVKAEPPVERFAHDLAESMGEFIPETTGVLPEYLLDEDIKPGALMTEEELAILEGDKPFKRVEVTEEEFKELKEECDKPDSPAKLIPIQGSMAPFPEPNRMPEMQESQKPKTVYKDTVKVDKWYHQKETPDAGRLLVVRRINDTGNNYWLGFFQDGDFINLGSKIPNDAVVSESSYILNRAQIERWAYYPVFDFE